VVKLSAVCRALVEAAAISARRVPAWMRREIHAFDAREGAFRVSLTYDAPTATGESQRRTETYHGHFVTLAPNERVAEVLELDAANSGRRRPTTEPACRWRWKGLATSGARRGVDRVGANGSAGRRHR
jgi:hypothetical protein